MMRIKEGNKELDILIAAVKVFSSVGFFDAKIHKIADEAGVASGTVYLYFKNKEEILLKIFEDVWERLFSIIEKIDTTEPEPVKKFHQMIDQVFEMFDTDPALATVFVNEQHHIMKKNSKLFTKNYQKTLSICECVVEEGISKGVFRKGINTAVFSSFFFGGIRYMLQQWAQNPRKIDLKDICKNLKEQVLYGICLKN
jgi:TetR/AcrR family fatty acid metabolism transcriptional regulator